MKKANKYTMGIPAYDRGKYNIDSIIKQAQKDAVKESFIEVIRVSDEFEAFILDDVKNRLLKQLED